MASDVELAWAAGFFDGEGSTSVLSTKRDKYTYLRMSVSQKNPQLLEKFLSIVGCGKIYKSNQRPIHSWDCYIEKDCESVLALLWPFLGEQKKHQADKARNKVAACRTKEKVVVCND